MTGPGWLIAAAVVGLVVLATVVLIGQAAAAPPPRRPPRPATGRRARHLPRRRRPEPGHRRTHRRRTTPAPEAPVTDFKITRRLAEWNDGEAKELHYRSFGDYHGPWQLDLGTWICLTSWGLGIEFEVELGGGWTDEFDVRRQLVLNLGPFALTAQYYRRPADWSWKSKFRRSAA